MVVKQKMLAKVFMKNYKSLCRISIRGEQGKGTQFFVVLDEHGIPNGQTLNQADIDNWFREMHSKNSYAQVDVV